MASTPPAVFRVGAGDGTPISSFNTWVQGLRAERCGQESGSLGLAGSMASHSVNPALLRAVSPREKGGGGPRSDVEQTLHCYTAGVR